MPSLISRRRLLQSSALLGAAGLMHHPLRMLAHESSEHSAQVIPFLQPQPKNPNRPMVIWEDLTEWLTPEPEVFSVGHYKKPAPAPADWKLSLGGMVRKPRVFTLEDLRRRPAREVVATLECSGNGASPAFMGAVANAKWRGTPLAPLLKEAGMDQSAIEIVFFGRDEGIEKIKDQELPMQFGRSLSRDKALSPDILLCYELNGQPLSLDHGAPVRLVVPGWYGVAWVKWLQSIQVQDRRYMGRYMARDYVSIRGQQNGEKVDWCENSVGPLNVKSIPARLLKMADGQHRLVGAAWGDGTPLTSVEVKVDDGEWQPARIEKNKKHPYAWNFWRFDWKDATPGEHTLTSRVTDARGRVQPSAEEPTIALKKTYYEANQQVVRKVRI